MPLIPNRMNIIWLGSYLRDTEEHPHQSRLKRWKALHPHHSIHLWINKALLDEATYQQFQSFCMETGIFLEDVETLSIAEPVRLWIQESLRRPKRNYGALSDIYRYYLLNEVGGWYFDTDIVPLMAFPSDLTAPTGFGVSLYCDKNQNLTYYTPDTIVSSPRSVFTVKAIEIIETMILNIGENILDLVQHHNPKKQEVGSHFTVGDIAFAACCRLIDEQSMPMLDFDIKTEAVRIRSLQLFQNSTLSAVLPAYHRKTYFYSADEKTWCEKQQNITSELTSEDAAHEFVHDVKALFHHAIQGVSFQPVSIAHSNKNRFFNNMSLVDNGWDSVISSCTVS